MLGILFSWLSPLRIIGIWIDTIAFSLIDDAYNLIVTFSSGTLLKQEFVENLMDNFYVIIGIFALFRIAMLLINSMINPEKLTEKGNGISNILVNFLVMFVLLIMTPVIFKEAINLQNVIVEGNYVQKIFINADSLKGKNPGKAMKSIAIGSLITIDEEALEQYGETDENGKAISSSCSKNCNEAIEDYREMEKKGFSFSTIAKHIGVTIKNDDGETVYVYNYMFLVTFAVGCFIAYVLFSFAIDIAVRMVELTVLQILAPLFIATYIDPKSAKSGTFHNWLTTFGKTYASLFIKLAILALMLLLISIVGNLDYYASDLDLSGFEKLILLIAILIFAKKAPKWITEMIGIKSEGLGGLGIGKKLGGAALVGNGLTKAGKAAVGAAGAVGSNMLRNTRHNRQLKKDAGIDLKGRHKAKQDYKTNNFGSAKGFRTQWSKDKKLARENNGLTRADKALRGVVGIGAGIVSGTKEGIKADKVTGAFKGGIKTGEQFASERGLGEKGILQKVGKNIGRVAGNLNDTAYGSGADRYDAIKTLEKKDKQDRFITAQAQKDFGDDFSNKILGMGDISKLKVKPHNIGDLYAAAYAKANGLEIAYDNAGKLKLGNYDASGDFVASTITRDEAYQSGRKMYTSEGAANVEKAYNTFQQNSLSESQSNAQSLNQIASSIAQMSSNLNNITVPGLNGTNGLQLADGTTLTLDKKSVSSLSNAYEEVNNKYHSETDPDRKEQYQNQITALGQMLSFETQIQKSVENMRTLQSRQGELDLIVSGIGNEIKVDKDGNIKEDTTNVANLNSNKELILNYLSTKSSDYDKEIAFYEKKNKADK